MKTKQEIMKMAKEIMKNEKALKMAGDMTSKPNQKLTFDEITIIVYEWLQENK